MSIKGTYYTVWSRFHVGICVLYVCVLQLDWWIRPGLWELGKWSIFPKAWPKLHPNVVSVG